MLKELEDTQSIIKKNQALIPDLSSIKNKINDFEVALLDHKKKTELIVDSACCKKFLSVENRLANVHQLMKTERLANNSQGVHSIQSSTTAQETHKNGDNSSPPKVLLCANNPAAPKDMKKPIPSQAAAMTKDAPLENQWMGQMEDRIVEVWFLTQCYTGGNEQ